MNSLKLLLIFSSIVTSMVCISIPMDKYHVLIGERCFNHTIHGQTLDQNGTVGHSVDNLIKLIEKIENNLPHLNTKQMTVLILRRFHLDGLELIGQSNLVSQIEAKHKRITEEILDSSTLRMASNIDFPEDMLTEEEKCALFFTISHGINGTILKEDNIDHAYSTNVSNALMPRENGVASFRKDNSTAIAMNRVLLGTAAGLLNPVPKTTRGLIKNISNINTESIPNGVVDPIYAVTLSDLLGTDSGSGLRIPLNPFAAKGEWNSITRPTRYTLTNNVTMATLAELKGGLDGWNIGRHVAKLFAENNKILKLSEILTIYYSPNGLTGYVGVCNRGYQLIGELQTKLQREAENYIRVWNGVYYENSFFDNQLTGFVAEMWPTYYRYLNSAAFDKSYDERQFCNPPISTTKSTTKVY